MATTTGGIAFQSAPPIEVRGDLEGQTVFAAIDKFQSAPPIEVRGDLEGQTVFAAIDKFQSAPPIEVRGDKTCLV